MSEDRQKTDAADNEMFLAPAADLARGQQTADEALAWSSEQVTELLDGIPGAYGRAQEGVEQARRGEGSPLEALTSET